MKRKVGPSVLVVDDEQAALDSSEMALCADGINNVLTCRDSRKVMELLENNNINLVLLDLVMPSPSGEELLPVITEKFPEIPVVIVTAVNDINKAVECMRMGAYDYMVKPLEANRLVISVRRALEYRELRDENTELGRRIVADSLEHPEIFSEIVSANPVMYAVFKYIEAIAGSSQCVLVTGETGVGKEGVVRAVHRLSGRSGKLVAVNVAGLDDTMFTDTLFGHVSGAYTGAAAQRGGLIEEAAGGTLFLDEIGDLETVSQVKLLRLLQEHEYYRLGEDIPRRTDARIIAATQHDLAARQAEGRLRNDLFYRLHVHHIHLPPLRERIDTDLDLLIDHFLKKAADQLRKHKPTAPPELVTLLRTYDFPGNIRELEMLIFDAVSRHKGRVLSTQRFRDHIAHRTASTLETTATKQGKGLNMVFPKPMPTLKQVAHLAVQEAMKRSEGNQNIAARMLGITPQALSRRLRGKTSQQ